MDCVFKASSSSWDLTELDIDEFDLLENNQNMEVFSVDRASAILGEKWSDKEDSTTASFPRGSSKKPRVSCLVDGCRADLGGCRDYHRRHRVCETHSKTPVVTIAGEEQRFCQQCSRFHSLGEFDEVKRSCRKRLDGHNKRRRKPRAESMYLNYESFFTNHQGTNLLGFGGSPAYSTTFQMWPDKQKLEPKLHATIEHNTPSNSYAYFCSAREKKFPFLLDADSDKVKVNQPFSEATFNTNASSGALSLLSKHTIHHHGSESSLTDSARFHGLLNRNSDPLIVLRDVTGSNSGDVSNHLIGMVHFPTERLLENEAAEVVSFSWE